MADLWFYMKGGHRFGPVGARVLRQLARHGELAPTDLVSRDGSGTWVDATRVRGLFPPAPSAHPTPAPPSGDEQYALDVPPPPPTTTADPPEPEGVGKLELDAACRFVLLHPLGLPTWIVAAGLFTFVFLILWIEKGVEGGRPLPDAVNYGVAGLVFLAWVGAYVGMRVSFGRQTACPRCRRPFSKLLLDSAARVVASREEVHTYTGQAAIRDRNRRVTGYVDEERSMPVTVKTVVGRRRYRCRSCGHRWEVSDVGRVVL